MTRVTAEIFDGLSIEHDSLVPLANGWCAEDQFDYHYYTAQADIGNQILDDLNFTIDGETGFRTYKGTAFNISIEYASSSSEIGGGVAQIGVDALATLHIDAAAVPADFNEYISRLDSHGDYDMVFYTNNFYSNDVDWLAYEYWSEYANTPYQNPTNFVNTSYDDQRDQLLYGTTYEDVYDAATKMQKILQYNVPRLVVFVIAYLQAYRNDVFTGHVEDFDRHIAGQWTMRNIKKLDGSPGGTASVGIYFSFDSFNIFTTAACSATNAYKTVFQNFWPSLYRYSPDLKPWPDIAESMITETHSDNAGVPDGHTRFTIDIIQNATWSDGEPLTAEDVAYSITYAYESAIYGNPVGSDIGDLYSATAPTLFRAVIEFTTESYWHFSTFAFDYIFPHHIFNEDDGIGYDEWNTWNPVLDPSEPFVNCGPFIFTDYEDGEFYKIERNPLFHYAIYPSDPITDPTSVTTSTTASTSATGNTNGVTGQEINGWFVFSFVIGSSSTVVIVVCLVSIIQNRNNVENI